MKRLKAIWSKRQAPRLLKELEWRMHTAALLEKQLKKERRIITALHIHLLTKRAK